MSISECHLENTWLSGVGYPRRRRDASEVGGLGRERPWRKGGESPATLQEEAGVGGVNVLGVCVCVEMEGLLQRFREAGHGGRGVNSEA